MADLRIVEEGDVDADGPVEPEKDSARWARARQKPLLAQMYVLEEAIDSVERVVRLMDEVHEADPSVEEIGFITLTFKGADITLISAAIQLVGVLSETSAERCQALIDQLDVENDRVVAEVTPEDKEKISAATLKVEEKRLERMFGSFSEGLLPGATSEDFNKHDPNTPHSDWEDTSDE